MSQSVAYSCICLLLNYFIMEVLYSSTIYNLTLDRIKKLKQASWLLAIIGYFSGHNYCTDALLLAWQFF